MGNYNVLLKKQIIGSDARSVTVNDIVGPRVTALVEVGPQTATPNFRLDAELYEISPATGERLLDGQVAKASITAPTTVELVLPFAMADNYVVLLRPWDTSGGAGVGGVLENVSVSIKAEPVINHMDHDGKQIVVINPASEGTETLYVGDGDDGTAMVIEFAGPGTDSIDLSFGRVIEVNDGEAWWNGSWDHTDKFSFVANLPATVGSNVGPGNGSYAKVEVPNTGGAANFFVPAAGGGWDIDLANAVPVPLAGKGFFDVDWDAAAGTVSVSAQAGTADYVLMDVPQSKALVRHIHMGNPLKVFTIDPYKVERIHPNWRVTLTCTKASAGAGNIGGWLMTFTRG